MVIDEKLLNKLEKLSAIEISKDKRDEMMRQLSNIVSFVEILNELDLSKVSAKVNTLENGLIFREDTPKSDKSVIETIFQNNKNSDNNFFVVPKIIE